MKAWREEITNCLGADIPVILFANKSDCVKGGKSTLAIGAECSRICEELGLYKWYFACAKDGDNVDDGFNQLVREMLRRRRMKEKEEEEEEGVGKGKGIGIGKGKEEGRGFILDQKQVISEKLAIDSCRIL